MAKDGYYTLSRQPVVNRAGDLTERVWRNAEPQLIEFMEKTERTRIRLDRIKTLEVRLTLLSDMWSKSHEEHRLGGFPSLRTFASIPEVREIFEAPNEVKTTAEALEALLPSLADILDRWRKTTKSQLEQRVQEMLQLPETPSASSLAIAAFYLCRRCLEVLDDHTVLSHSCSIYNDDTTSVMDPLDFVFQRHGVFDPTNLFMDVELAKPVIIACGQDPLVTTADAMDRLDIKLTCLKDCCKYDGVRSVMSWRSAVFHDLKRSSSLPLNSQWVEASEYDKELVARLEQVATREGKLSAKYGWRCQRCPYSKPRYGGSHSNVLEHLRTSHNIAEPSGDDDLCKSQWTYFKPPYLIANDVEERSIPYDIIRAMSDGTAAYETQRAVSEQEAK